MKTNERQAAALHLLGARFKTENRNSRKKGPQHLINSEVAYLACSTCIKVEIAMKMCFIGFAVSMCALFLASISDHDQQLKSITFVSMMTLLIAGLGMKLAWFLCGGSDLKESGTLEVAYKWLPARKFLISNGFLNYLTNELFPHKPGANEWEKEEVFAREVIQRIMGWTAPQSEYHLRTNSAFRNWLISLAKEAATTSKAGYISKYQSINRMIETIIGIMRDNFHTLEDKGALHRRAEQELATEEMKRCQEKRPTSVPLPA